MSLIDDALACRAGIGPMCGDVVANEQTLCRLREKWLTEFRERAAQKLDCTARHWRASGADISASVTKESAKIIRALPLDKEPI